jgi:hypothetical protein
MAVAIRSWEKRSGGPAMGRIPPVSPTDAAQGKLVADLHSRIDTSLVRGVGDTEVRWGPMSATSGECSSFRFAALVIFLRQELRVHPVRSAPSFVVDAIREVYTQSK